MMSVPVNAEEMLGGQRPNSPAGFAQTTECSVPANVRLGRTVHADDFELPMKALYG